MSIILNKFIWELDLEQILCFKKKKKKKKKKKEKKGGIDFWM